MLNETIAEIQLHYRFYCDYMAEQTALTKRMKAMCRRTVFDPSSSKEANTKTGNDLFEAIISGETPMEYKWLEDHLLKFRQAEKVLAAERNVHERIMKKLALTLPGASFVENTIGFGANSLAKIVGEAGDLSQWTLPQFNKRMGLACDRFGRRQRLWTNEEIRKVFKIKGPIPDDLRRELSYVPSRRSVMYVVGVSIIRKKSFAVKMTGDLTVWQKLYYARKEYETEKNERGDYAEQAEAQVHAARARGEKPNSENLAGRLTKSHINNRAKRYMEKRLMKALWQEWRN